MTINYKVEKINYKIARDYIKENHYSHGCHGGASPCYGLFDNEDIIGVLMFATPCSENVRASVFGKDYKNHVTELHRLHIKDVTPKNTESWFISKCFKLLKQDKPHIWAVVSFADMTEGHSGVIYKATNAYRVGSTGKSTFYIDRDGRLRHPRQNGVNISKDKASELGWVAVKREAKNRFMWLLPDDKRHKRKLIELASLYIEKNTKNKNTCDIAILFDLDDTIIETQNTYENIKKNVSTYIASIINDKNISSEYIISKFEEVDCKNVDIYGFSKHRFSNSWIETFESVCMSLNKNHLFNTNNICNVKYIADKVFNTSLPLVNSIEEIIREIKINKNIKLYILTVGDIEIQKRKIDELKIKDLFNDFYIVDKKKYGIMKKISKNNSVTMMVGNSLKSDINPALENGLIAIHIKKETWEYDHCEIDYNNEKYYSTTIDELPLLVKDIIKNIENGDIKC